MNLDMINQTNDLIRASIYQTPLIRLITLEQSLGLRYPLYGKCENQQVTESFKIRGAFALLHRLRMQGVNRPVSVRSSGNFAQALAFAAGEAKVRAQIVMPTIAPKKKIARVREYGAELHLHGTTHQEGYRYLDQLSVDHGSLKVSSFDHADVILGQGTCGLEVYEELPTIKHFYAPVGGGGLMAGCAIALKESNPQIEVIAAEPDGAKKCYLSKNENRLVEVETVTTIADGLRSPRLGRLNWPIIQRYLDRVKLVSDAEVVAALRWLYQDYDLVLEPSGVVSIAGLIADTRSGHSFQGPVVCVLSGGNVDPEVFQKMVT